jgi:hypothetical protein
LSGSLSRPEQHAANRIALCHPRGANCRAGIELTNKEFGVTKFEDGLVMRFAAANTPDWATDWATPRRFESFTGPSSAAGRS